MIVTVVAGNPKPQSRTLAAGIHVAELIAGAPVNNVIDVITLGPSLLGWGDPAVATAVRNVASSDLVVFASPTFKASYTGVLKLFLDQFATGSGLESVVAVPLMLGAGLAHGLAPELLLKPVLVELGAVVPAQGLYLTEQSWAEPESTKAWLDRWGPVIHRCLPAS